METHITIMGVSPARHNEPRAQVHPARQEADPLGRMGRSPRTGNLTRQGHAMGAHDSKNPSSNLQMGESANLAPRARGQASDSRLDVSDSACTTVIGCCRAIVPANRVRRFQRSCHAFSDVEMLGVRSP